MLPPISPWLRLDSGVGVRDHPTVPSAGHLGSQWPGDPWWCNTIALGEEDYRNKLDTIYPFVSFSLTCSPPPQNDHRRLCKDLIWTEPEQVWYWILAHILTSLSFVLNDWSWFRHELPMTEVWQRKSDFVWGWPRQNSLTRICEATNMVCLPGPAPDHISKMYASNFFSGSVSGKVADFITVPT